MKQFRDIHGNQVDLVDYSFHIIQTHPGAKIYVGTDSQKKRSTIDYATVIAYRYGTRGCHIVYRKWSVDRRGYGRGDQLMERRLVDEITETINTAQLLTDSSIHVEQVDLDLNGDPKWKSNRMVQMGVGWAKGLGYRVSIKPDLQVATKAANHLVS